MIDVAKLTDDEFMILFEAMAREKKIRDEKEQKKAKIRLEKLLDEAMRIIEDYDFQVQVSVDYDHFIDDPFYVIEQ